MHGAGGYSWWFDTTPPANLTASAPLKGGSIPIGTYVYAVSMTGADGAETITSPPTVPVTISSPGIQQVNLSWTASLGAYSYNVYRCNTAIKTPGCVYEDGTLTPQNISPWYQIGQHVMGTAFSDTFVDPIYQRVLPQVSGTGSTVLNNTGVYAPVVQAGAVSAGGGAVQFRIRGKLPRRRPAGSGFWNYKHKPQRGDHNHRSEVHPRECLHRRRGLPNHEIDQHGVKLHGWRAGFCFQVLLRAIDSSRSDCHRSLQRAD